MAALFNQSIAFRPMSALIGSTGNNRPTSSRMPQIIRCSKDNKQPFTETVQDNIDPAASPKQSISGSSGPTPLNTARPEAGTTSFATLFAFDGPAPETINGRLAMVGIVWALVAEKLTGLDVAQQLFDPATSGLLYFGFVVQLFSVASLIPFFKGESRDGGRQWGPFNAKAEQWNGRLAMIGFAALLIDEAIRQAPFIHLA